ncbi:hypothetical protein PRIPAC_77665, partial [Pristionchus pacificus]|uniref:G protein-coupled receptor n=1 Tax=Pristionchus pacificus TaxID=54126 RepID=A0A2A6CJ93_PRIPA
ADSPEDWARLYGERQIARGAWSIFLGCISLVNFTLNETVLCDFTQILYVPAIRVINREKKHNCVKVGRFMSLSLAAEKSTANKIFKNRNNRIMRFLALVDMLGIFACGILFGIQMLQGAVFCSHKIFVLITCLTGYVCWNVSSLNCLFLVVNRIFELRGKDFLFKGLRGTSIMFASGVYGIVSMLFTPPFLTNSRCQTLHLNKSVTTKNLQTIIFTQATIICGLNILGALPSYSLRFILMNYIQLPQLALLIGMIGYQLIHASPCLIYIVLNPTVRKELWKMFGVQNGAVQDNGAFTTASSSISATAIHPPGEWWTAEYGQYQPAFGWWSIAWGTVCEVLYLPIIVALYEESKRISCYKIMLWLAVIDIIAILANSIFFGILLIKGYVFCSNPWFVWMVGCIGLGMWCGASANCLLLVTNRLFELLNYSHFSARNTTYYLMLTLVYIFYFTFLTPPILTNSKEKGMFFDPFIGPARLETFSNWPHTANNLLIVMATAALYFSLCIVLVVKQGGDGHRARLKQNKAIFIQATLICVFNVVASLVYVYMNFFPTSQTLVEIGHLSWQFSHGAPPYIYLLLNKTVQERCRKLMGIRRPRISTITPATQTVTSSQHVMRQNFELLAYSLSHMVRWEDIVDIVLCTLYIYLLMRLATAKDEHFKKPFFLLFIVTGVYSVISVFAYQILANFTFSEQCWTVFFYKPIVVLNGFGAQGATFGKATIAIHRFFVIRSRDFAEKKWSRGKTWRILALECLLALFSNIYTWFSTYSYTNKETKEIIAGLSPLNTIIQKVIAVVTYALYIICNGIFTFLSSRELYRLKSISEEHEKTSRQIIIQERNMFIIVTVCSISHFLKALQMSTVAVAIFLGMDQLSRDVLLMYPLVNGLASYAAPICLVILSSTVRSRLLPSIFRTKKVIDHDILNGFTFVCKMAGWGEVLPDIILCSLYIIQLVRLATARDDIFKRPFYIFFIVTGIYSVFTVIGYQVAAQFPYSDRYWTIVFFKPAFALNAFGAQGAIFGKATIAVHRYFVLRRRDFNETKWSRRLVWQIVGVECVLSAVSTASIWPATYIYYSQNGMDNLVLMSHASTQNQKIIGVVSYVLYIICNGIFTALTSRELYRLREMLGDNTETSRKIMTQQRNMFIIVIVCSLSHFIKGLHQLAILIVTYFGLEFMNKILWPLYPFVNGLATYAAPLCLVLLSPTVRSLIFPNAYWKSVIAVDTTVTTTKI